MRIQASPVVALDRAVAIAQRDGPESGLDAPRESEGTPIASRTIHSTPPRSVSWSSGPDGRKRRACISCRDATRPKRRGTAAFSKSGRQHAIAKVENDDRARTVRAAEHGELHRSTATRAEGHCRRVHR
jgi:hypothetical protein